ncbi:MAG: nucleotidyltransferase family protein [Pseudomonadota bacterium]
MSGMDTAMDTAMVMAAGFGTRMGALTRTRPKPMLPLTGRPMIDLTLDHVADAGLSRAVVNLHYRGDQIREHLTGRERPQILFSEEQPEILDTGGGIVQALPLLGAGPFAVLNSDAVFVGPNPVEHLLRYWDPDRLDALMLMVPVEQTIAYTRQGDFFLDASSGVPLRRGDAERAPFVYAGAQIIRPEAFATAPEGPFSTNLIWNALLAESRLQAVAYPGKWIDVGTPEGLVEAEAALGAHAP